ncbi:MAG: hypothetical protein GC136_07300 [Alphaproteobacteria bacterium]|nr:hypothetical protein [Alphaproteobacteria bacterium]
MAQDKSWLIFDGRNNPPIPDYNGPDYRFPIDLAEYVISRFCSEGGTVLDPFAGFGTSFLAARALNRKCYGFEKDPKTYETALKIIGDKPETFINDSIQNVENHGLEKADLIFTSPPYASFRGTQNDPEEIYFKDFEEIFLKLKNILKPTGKLVVEIANVHDNRGALPLAFIAALTLRKHYKFEYEIINCAAGNTDDGEHYDHSYILVFSA